jgi:hypothetical protein
MEQLLKTTIGDPNANEFDLKLKELMMHTWSAKCWKSLYFSYLLSMDLKKKIEQNI